MLVALALLAGCHPADAKAPPADLLASEPELGVEVELLDLPATADLDELAATVNDLQNKDPSATDLAQRDRTPREKFVRGTERPPDGAAGDGDAMEETELESPDQPPPPPPPPPRDTGDSLKQKSIRQATGESVGGHVESASIQDAVARNRPVFTRCLRTDSKVVMEATIASSGDVLEARSTSSQPDDPKLRDCVVDAFKRLKLRPLAGSQPARVKFALALKRSGDH